MARFFVFTHTPALAGAGSLGVGEVILFPGKFNGSMATQLKSEGCRVRIEVTLDPEAALDVIYALGQANADIMPGSIVIVRPDGKPK